LIACGVLCAIVQFDHMTDSKCDEIYIDIRCSHVPVLYILISISLLSLFFCYS